MKNAFIILFVLCLLIVVNTGCRDKKNNHVSTFSEAELINIRDGFDERVSIAFEAERGKPLKRASIVPPLRSGSGDFIREYSFSLVSYAARCFWLNEKIDSANFALIENADYYLNDTRKIHDRDSFHWHAEMLTRLIELFGQFGTKHPGLLKLETENKILEVIWLYCMRTEDSKLPLREHFFGAVSSADHEISNTWFIKDSENHHAQSITTLWHFAKLAKERDEFKDRLYGDGLKAVDHYAQWNEYAKMYLTERAKKGMFIEMMCIGYNTVTLKGIFNFYDFTEDEELKRKTGQFLDLYFTYWGQEQIDGVSGGGKARIYSDISASTSELGYYFFGIGNIPRFKCTLLSALTTSFRPSLVVVDIACDVNGRGAYEVIQQPLGLATDTNYNRSPHYRMLTDSGGILRYSYCTPDFIMGTPMVESRPYQDWAAISSQNRSHGVIFKGDHHAAILPQCEKNGAVFNAQWSVQRKGTLISQKLKTNRNAGKTRIWYAGSGLSTPIEEQGWIFAESEGAYAALHVVDGASFWEAKKESVPGSWLYCENEYSPVILEVVQKADYNSFQEFKTKVTSQTINYKDNILNYSGLYGDLFTLYADFLHSPKINNVTVDYAPAKVFDSPFLQADWNSGIVHIQKGERKLVLDFNQSN